MRRLSSLSSTSSTVGASAIGDTRDTEYQPDACFEEAAPTREIAAIQEKSSQTIQPAGATTKADERTLVGLGPSVIACSAQSQAGSGVEVARVIRHERLLE